MLRDAGNQFFWAVFGFITGLIFEAIGSSLRRFISRYRMKREVERMDEESLKALGVVSLDHADPHYEPPNVSIRPTGKKLFVGIPTKLRDDVRLLDERFTFNEDTSLDGTDRFDDIARSTQISRLPQLIKAHANTVGNQFLRSLQNQHGRSNGRKYGVHNVLLRRYGEPEQSGLVIEAFETDYFTHRVFRSIYHELRAAGHPIAEADKYSYSKYTPFTTSLGVNAYVLLEHGGETFIVFAKRSTFVANTSKSKWHVTVNEGLSADDLSEGRISIVQCLERGLGEEMGVTLEHRGSIAHMRLYDMFLEKNNFEIGMTGAVKLRMSPSRLMELYETARDGSFEIDDLEFIPYTRRAIQRFVQEHKGEFTTAGLYSQRMILAREL